MIRESPWHEFATFPPPDRQPAHPSHTPAAVFGAAAVADCMLPLAFGTQTAGSVIRPAAFCGVIGYKPSYGTLPRNGVKLLADSLDTVGILACSAEDAALLISALTARASLRIGQSVPAPRLAVCRTPQWPAAQPETVALFEGLSGQLVRAGAYVGKLDLPAPFAGLEAAQETIWEYEMARNLADEFHRHRDRIREPLRASSPRAGRFRRALDAAKALARDCRAGWPTCSPTMTRDRAFGAGRGSARPRGDRQPGVPSHLDAAARARHQRTLDHRPERAAARRAGDRPRRRRRACARLRALAAGERPAGDLGNDGEADAKLRLAPAVVVQDVLAIAGEQLRVEVAR